MQMSLFTALCGVVLFPALSRAQSAADSAGIRTAALDYIDGWYAADGERMERALHPELASKRYSASSRRYGRRREQTRQTPCWFWRRKPIPDRAQRSVSDQR
jgi:Putative lumazine-binding